MTRRNIRTWAYSAAVTLGLSLGLMLAGHPAHAQFGMSRADEDKIGAEQHPKILAEFGGAYNEGDVGAYVAEVVGRVASQSPMDPGKVRVTVLNSPIVNAMALPGGYVYATRGLLALANTEAELAGVLGHEIGHVVARHAAKRYNKAMGLSLGGALLSGLLGNQTADQLINMGGTLWLLKNSRDDEYEADGLGTQYIAQAGYDPIAMSSFLMSMDMQTQLHAQLAGQSYDPSRVDYLSTHPNTQKRVQRAEEIARQTAGGDTQRRLRHLKAIDGMIYGDDPEQGFIRGNTFSHPVLKFTFQAPEGFRLINSPTSVIAAASNAQVKFDFGRNTSGSDMKAHIQKWAKGQRISELKSGKIGGMNAATAIIRNLQIQSGRIDARLYAVAFSDGQVAQFVGSTPTNATDEMGDQIWQMAESFRRLSAKQAKALKPLRVRRVQAKSGDTIQSMSKKMAFADNQRVRFRTLNRLQAGQSLRSGAWYKIVTE